MNSASLLESIRTLGDPGKLGMRRAWGWWSGEMLSMMPDRARQALDERKPTLVVALHDDHASADLYRGEHVQKIATLAMHPDSTDGTQNIRAAIDTLAPSLSATVVHLPEERTLQRKITLPQETEEKLADVLGFEMDRLTPFSKDEVCFDYSVVDRNKARRTIDVSLTVAKKNTVEQVVDTLAGYGVRPTTVTVSDQSLPAQQNRDAGAIHNLLPHDFRGAPRRQVRYLSLLLPVLVAFLAATAVLLPVYHLMNVRAELDGIIAEAKTAAMAAGETRSEIERVVHQGRFFARKRAELPRAVQVLEEITRVLPDDTVLTRFELAGTRVRVEGESDSASSLISLVEGTKLFHRAGFSSPVTKNPRTNRDRFALVAEIVTAGDAT